MKNALLDGVRQQLAAMEKSGAVVVTDREAAELGLAGCLVAGMQGQTAETLALVGANMTQQLREMISATKGTLPVPAERWNVPGKGKGGLN